MLKSLFCDDVSVEYELKSEKFKGGIDQLKIKLFGSKGKHNGIQNIADAPTLTSIYIDLHIRDGICQFVVLKHFGWNFCTGILVAV